MVDSLENHNDILKEVLDEIIKQKLVKSGDNVIITSGDVANLSGRTNNIKI